MYIYKVTNLINGKFYIGQQSHKRKNYIGSGILIKKAIKKYGRDNFKKEILEECKTKESLNKCEIYWIKKLHAIKEGYNISKGGGNREYNKLKLTKDEELTIIKLYKDGKTLVFISNLLGYSLTKIQNVLKENNVELYKRKLDEKTKEEWSKKYTKKPTDYFNKDIINQIIQLFNDNYTKTEISKELNLDLKKIKTVLKKLNLKRFTHNRKGKFNNSGNNNPNYKYVHIEIKDEIINEYSIKNMTISKLALKYNLGYKKIRSILLENNIEIKRGPKI